jgi:cell division protein FtsI (penicillin-binding protein 3)
MLVRRLVDADGQVFAEYPPQPVRQVLRPNTARLTSAALQKAASSEGTGARATLDHYNVAGKTGTAQIPFRGGYLRNKNIHSFIGYLPAEAPEICISVVLEQPEKGRYASSTAAPTFRAIAELAARHLGLRPDREITELASPPAMPRNSEILFTTQNRPDETP